MDKLMQQQKISLFESYDSNVRVYCRKFPIIFQKAKNCWLWDEQGKRYLDFFSCAGVANYGHNNEQIKQALIDYINSDGIIHSLDFYTTAKYEFIRCFTQNILAKRQLDYKIQFTGPTGTNAVEAALKIARKVTGRSTIFAFTNGFHGMTLGSLAVSGNKKKRREGGVGLNDVIRVPYDGYLGPDYDSLEYIRKLLNDAGSGIELPAAFIVETIQAEGGVFTARLKWLHNLQTLAQQKNILLIVDDIQTGCGRTGNFFSFETAGIYPDMVCLSKSMGGTLPLSMVLLKPTLDVQKSGGHTSTFRGNNLAFVAATIALSFWENQKFLNRLHENIEILAHALQRIHDQFNQIKDLRGRGFLKGLVFESPEITALVLKKAFESGLLLETCGADNEVIKIMPPLIISKEALLDGLSTLERVIKISANNHKRFDTKEPQCI